MNTCATLKTLALVSLGLIADTPGRAADMGQKNVAAFFGSKASLDTVRLAHEVDACILRRIPGTPKSGARPATPDRYEESDYVAIPAPLIADLSEKLLDPRSYAFPVEDGVVLSKFCVPVYQVRLRFTLEDDVVAVDFCFGCVIARALHNGREIKTADFDPSYATFRNAFVTLFPADETLKKTKPKL
jgi:hypothetical protein